MQGVFAYIGTVGGRKMSVGFSGGYTFGFNGKERIDEAYGDANAYDFGARIYDPRVGRWLAVDPLGGIQADQSAYKAFLNNPIFYIDPDGNTEYISIQINDQRDNSTTIIKIPVSDEVMTDGQRIIVWSGSSSYHLENNYYDYERQFSYTIDKGGNLTVNYENREKILNGREAKQSQTIWSGKGAAPGDKKHPSEFQIFGLEGNGGTQESGFFMVSKGGGASPTRFVGRFNVKTIKDIDLLVATLGGLSPKEITKSTKWADRLKNAADFFVKLSEVQEGLGIGMKAEPDSIFISTTVTSYERDKEGWSYRTNPRDTMIKVKNPAKNDKK